MSQNAQFRFQKTFYEFVMIDSRIYRFLPGTFLVYQVRAGYFEYRVLLSSNRTRHIDYCVKYRITACAYGIEDQFFLPYRMINAGITVYRKNHSSLMTSIRCVGVLLRM